MKFCRGESVWSKAMVQEVGGEWICLTRSLSSYSMILLWVCRFAYYPVLFWLYRRFGAFFLKLMIIGNTLLIGAELLDEVDWPEKLYVCARIFIAVAGAAGITIFAISWALCMRWLWINLHGHRGRPGRVWW
jgi:hypothetical protein